MNNTFKSIELKILKFARFDFTLLKRFNKNLAYNNQQKKTALTRLWKLSDRTEEKYIAIAV